MPQASTTVPFYPFRAEGSKPHGDDTLGVHVGDLSSCLEARGRSRLHRHDHFEIFWIPRGHGAHTNDFRVYPLETGMMIFVSPGHVHGWDVRTGTRGKTISFTRDFFLGDTEGERLIFGLPFFFPASSLPLLKVPKAERARIEATLALLESEFHARRIARATMLRSCLQMLLIESHRLYERVHKTATPAHGTASAQLTRRFHLLVETNFAMDDATAGYARSLGVSLGHLRDTIMVQTGRTVGELIRERRLLEARRLLAHTELTIAEIAYRVGFKEASYFGRAFRQQEKHSPGQFRARFRGKYQNPF